MTITPKEKELAAVGISVAAACKPCTDYHVGVARKARASDQEIRVKVNRPLTPRGRTSPRASGDRTKSRPRVHTSPVHLVMSL